MQKILALDWYTNKYLNIDKVSPEIEEKLQIGDKIVYEQPDQKTGAMKLSIGTIITEGIQVQNINKEKLNFFSADFVRILEGEEKSEFETQQEIALKIFPTFKREFQESFPGSVPITARFQIFSDQLYFFFFSEERYVFTDFVKNFREKLGKNMFLFQVGARDMMRMSPGADGMLCSAGQTLCCKNCRVLPNIEIENIVMQNLEGRDVEKLKGKCGKLKCCLLYELDMYVNESKKYPRKGSKVDVTGLRERRFEDDDNTGVVTSYNILTGEVSIKTKNGFLRIPVDKLHGKVKTGFNNSDIVETEEIKSDENLSKNNKLDNKA